MSTRPTRSRPRSTPRPPSDATPRARGAGIATRPSRAPWSSSRTGTRGSRPSGRARRARARCPRRCTTIAARSSGENSAATHSDGFCLPASRREAPTFCSTWLVLRARPLRGAAGCSMRVCARRESVGFLRELFDLVDGLRRAVQQRSLQEPRSDERRQPEARLEVHPIQ